MHEGSCICQAFKACGMRTWKQPSAHLTLHRQRRSAAETTAAFSPGRQLHSKRSNGKCEQVSAEELEQRDAMCHVENVSRRWVRGCQSRSRWAEKGGGGGPGQERPGRGSRHVAHLDVQRGRVDEEAAPGQERGAHPVMHQLPRQQPAAASPAGSGAVEADLGLLPADGHTVIRESCAARARNVRQS